MEIKLQNIREAGNRGAFYPQSCKEIQEFIKMSSEDIYRLNIKNLLQIGAKAIVSPHAGYVYSGFTANIVHKILANTHVKSIVVIGPSHYVYFNGISASFAEYYETPCGNLKIDTKLLLKLHDKFNFRFEEQVHFKEHSTETQMPFIKHYSPQTKVVELVYSNTVVETVSDIISYVLEEKDTAVVISSDLSHFHSLEVANLLDDVCMKAFKKRDLNLLNSGCEACGIIGIKALLKTVAEMGLQTDVVDYRTSADVLNDKKSVVGYMGGIVWNDM